MGRFISLGHEADGPLERLRDRWRLGEDKRAGAASWARRVEDIEPPKSAKPRGQQNAGQESLFSEPAICPVCKKSHGTPQVMRTPDGVITRKDEDRIVRDTDRRWKEYAKRKRALEKDIKRTERSIDSCVKRMAQSPMHEEREAARRGLEIERVNLKKKQAELENLDWATYRA